MKLTKAKNVSLQKVSTFLKHNHQVDLTNLLKSGYIVEMNEKIIACFNLEPVNQRIFWLRQLYIIQTEAIKLPALVESILALAKALKAERIFVKSHKLMVDLILESLLFKMQEDGPVPQLEEDHGKWWVYEID